MSCAIVSRREDAVQPDESKVGLEIRGGTTTTVAKMKSFPTDDDAFGPGRVRADGRGEFPAYLFQVKTPAESKSEWDIYKLLTTVPVEDVLHPLNDKRRFPVL